MKKILYIALFVYAGQVGAADISYTVINGVSTTSTSTVVSVMINNIVKKTNYDCILETLLCTQTKETVSPRIENPLWQMDANKITEKYVQLALAAAAKASSTPVSTSTSVVAPIQKPSYAPFTVPTNARCYPNEAQCISISPDGSKIAYYSATGGTVKQYRSYVVRDTLGNSYERFELLSPWDIITETPHIFGWTSDSTTLVYLYDGGAYATLRMVDFTKDQPNLVGEPLLTGAKYTVLDFAVSGRKIYFIANKKGPYVWGLFEVDIDTKKVTELSRDVMYTNDLVIANDKVLFTENKNGTGVLRAYDIAHSAVVEFTGLIQDSAEVLPFTVVNTQGVKGVLMTPKAKSKEAIIWLHGGPFRETSPERHSYGSYATYDWILDEMVSNGAAVLKVDYPGSLGYGTAFTKSIVGKVGANDVTSVKNAIAYLKKKGYTSIYLFGNSYGGYLSLKGLAELNGSLAGAVAVAPVTDWQKLIEQYSPTPFEAHFNGTPDSTNKALYKKADIIGSMSKSTKPFLVFHGELDTQVPVKQSEYLFGQLTEKGVPITYYALGQSGHVIGGVAQNEAMCKTVAEYMKIVSKDENFCVMK